MLSWWDINLDEAEGRGTSVCEDVGPKYGGTFRRWVSGTTPSNLGWFGRCGSDGRSFSG